MTDFPAVRESAVAEALATLEQLTPPEKLLVMERLAALLAQQWRQPLITYYGAAASVGSTPSAEDIADMRREVWMNFPREDLIE